MSVQIRWEPTYITEELPSTLPERPLRRRKATRSGRHVRSLLVLLSCAVICGLATVGAARLLQIAKATPSLQWLRPASPGAAVVIGAASAERRLGFVTVSGNATNRTGHSLADVEAVVELLDSRGQTVGLESALAAFDPMPVGESTPFQVELPDNAQAVSYRVRFRQLLGQALN